MHKDLKLRMADKQAEYEQRVQQLMDEHTAEIHNLNEQNKLYKLLINELRTENKDLRQSNTKNIGIIEDQQR